MSSVFRRAAWLWATSICAAIAIVTALLSASSPAAAQFTQQGGKLVGTGAVGAAGQGRSAALSADGNTAIVGGRTDNANAGAVWVYTRAGGVWSQQGTKLTGTGAVGAALQGSSVALSADGNTAIVGGFGDNANAGAAWVFTRSGGVWTQQGGKLVANGTIGFPRQGSSVALSADGNTAMIGGPNDNTDAGAVWVFTRSGGVWSQQGNKLVGSGAVGAASQGLGVALSADGNTAIVGGNGDNANAGAVWVYTRSGGVWSQQGGKLVGSGAVGASQQGLRVALSDDGNTAIVGGNSDNANTGAVWVFTRSGGVWSQQGGKLVGTGAVGAALQGNSVALSGNGITAMVGGISDNLNAGAAWVFVVPVYVCNVVPRLGDFNGDGRSDMMLRRDSDGTLAQYQMNDFTVAAAQVLGAIGTEWTMIGAADFNGDGKSDLLFRRGSDGLLAQYQMNGFAITAAALIGAIGTDWDRIGLGDFNGDGRADMLFRRSSDGLLAMYLMDGFTITAAQVIGAIGTDWTLIGIGDFNGDGRADMLLRRSSDGQLAMYLMNGFAVTAAQLIGAIGIDWSPVGVGDLNIDGKSDMLFRHTTDGALAGYLMNGFSFLSAAIITTISLSSTPVGTGDVTGAGGGNNLIYRNPDGSLVGYEINGLFFFPGQNFPIGTVGFEWNSCPGIGVQ